jgi:membrane protease YdiL (CAAX protease family)
MTQIVTTRSSTHTGTALDPDGSRFPRQLKIFLVLALGVGWPLLALSTLIQPGGPFLIAAVLFGLSLPALVLTHRQAGRAGVHALLRDCVRLPSRWWWLLLASFGLPAVTWVIGAALGGAQPLTWSLVAFYTADLIIGALVINIWEEMAWTGFFQRRATSRWGAVGGGLITSVFFAGIHIPLALDGAHSAIQVATNLLYLVGVAIGVRLLIARVDPWSGRSLLVVGLLHSSFNAAENLLQPEFFWVRIVVTIALGIGVAAFGRQPHPPEEQSAGHPADVLPRLPLRVPLPRPAGAGVVVHGDRGVGRGQPTDPDPRPNWVARHDLVVYFVLAFAVSWSIWPLAALNPDSSPLVPFGPLIAAVVVSTLAGGTRQLRDLLGQLTRWRVHPLWYLIAIVGPFLVGAITAALTVAAGAPAPNSQGYTDWLSIVVTLVSTIVIVGLFEELGWRGFALPRLQRRQPALQTALALGAIWALWHLPELISDPTGQRPPVQFVVGILAQSVVLAWLYNSTNASLPIVILFHATLNTAGRFMLPGFVDGYYQLAWSIMTAIYVLIALVVATLGGPGRLVTTLPRAKDTTRRPQRTTGREIPR